MRVFYEPVVRRGRRHAPGACRGGRRRLPVLGLRPAGAVVVSAWVLSWAWSLHGLSDGAHLLACYLADQADDDGVVGLYRSISRKDLGDLFDVSVDTIDRRLRELQAGDPPALRIQKRASPAGGGGVLSIPSVYHLQSPPKRQGRKVAALDEMADEDQGRTVAAVDEPGPQIAQIVPLTRAADGAETRAADRPYHTPDAAGVAADGAESGPNAALARAAPVAAPIEQPLPPPIPPPFGDGLPAVGDPSIPKHTISRKADWLVHVLNDPLLDPSKFAALQSGATQVDRWNQSGASMDVILGVFRGELIKRKQANKGPIKSWGLLTDDVRAAAVRELTPLENFAEIAAMENANARLVGADKTNDASGAPTAPRRASGGEPGGILGAAVRISRARGGAG